MPGSSGWSSRASSTPRELSNLIKELEADGLAFEGAEASFELLIRRHGADYVAPFRIVDYTCLIEQRDGRELLAEATVKVEVDGEVLHTAADGNGPVNALDAALRKALWAFYPGLDEVHLVDYKVRILDGGAATAARTRVIIDSMDGARTWSTMGSDTNIIAASASALADSLEYAIWKSGSELRRRDERHFTTARTRTRARPSPPTARPRLPGGDPMTDLPADALAARPMDGHVRQQRPQPRRRRHRLGRPRLAGVGRGQRRDRRAVPGRRRGARGRPHRPPAPARLRHPRARGGDRHDRGRQRPDRAARHRRRARRGRVRGRGRGPNIIAASIEAYIAALNPLLAESHWSGATEAAGNRKGVAVSAGTAREQRADLDEAEVPNDTTAWFER